jgi:tripeptide aminopeptidase
MDTVVPGADIKPVIKGGLIKSRGRTILGADDKAGLAAIIEALTVIKENKIQHAPLALVFTVAEEIGLKGADALKSKSIKADYGYIFDGEGKVGDLVTSTPYYDRLEITVKGRAAHAGIEPEQGVNALAVAARAISRIKQGRLDRESTCNLGTIKGGRAENIIPDQVIIKGEVRSRNLAKLKNEVGKIKKVFMEAARRFGGSVTFKVEREFDGFSLGQSHDLVKRFTKACRSLKLKSRILASGGGSDANKIVKNLHVPCGVAGIGLCKPHSLDEYIRISELVKTAGLIVEIVKRT